MHLLRKENTAMFIKVSYVLRKHHANADIIHISAAHLTAVTTDMSDVPLQSWLGRHARW